MDEVVELKAHPHAEQRRSELLEALTTIATLTRTQANVPVARQIIDAIVGIHDALAERVAQLESDLTSLIEQHAFTKASTDLTIRALVYQAGGYVAIKKVTLEEIPNVKLYATETSDGQLVMRTVREVTKTPQ